MLPTSIVLRPVLNNRGYLNYLNEDGGIIRPTGMEVYNPLGKIEVERASTDGRFVHLRFSCSNKYWAPSDAGGKDSGIAARIDQPEEDRSKRSCTLFEPTIDEYGQVSFLHVRGGYACILELSNQPILGLSAIKMEISSGWCLFSVVNWDSLVIMPKNVAFKGRNNRYLKSVTSQNRAYLQFSSNDRDEEENAYEVFLQNDGTLRIKSRFFDKFWRYDNSNWIMPKAPNGPVERSTSFRPVMIDSTTIALQSTVIDKFCSSQGNNNQLAASASTITSQARLKVEELVLEREILDIRYRMEDARIYDESPFAAGSGTASNQTQHPSIMTICVSYEDTSEYSFANSLTVNFGVSLCVKSGVPLIAESEITISTEIINSFEWRRTTTQSKKVEATYQVTVPPMSWVGVRYVGTQGRCNVPFSYVQRDKLSRDGSFVTTEHVDGVFTGVNNYNFHFENLQVSRL